ncbi:hypothetical protein BOSE62_80048 [Bosea sp. 62]|nr:hypothetical protein BOSE7B_60699 [Bosea sp. 7B]VXB48417.1 hypothetical protein BOSE127_120160 [Bosea sp. 127]VXC84019.1 hypothetical protein BOSE125_560003 [Bosea sp. 125]VXC95454.1 hypothetical protein BOSE62_80048 [Bosea sp. 62]
MRGRASALIRCRKPSRLLFAERRYHETRYAAGLRIWWLSATESEMFSEKLTSAAWGSTAFDSGLPEHKGASACS